MQIASAATTVKFHEFPSGTVVHNYQPGTKVQGPIKSISWSKGGGWLALTPHAGHIEIVSIKEQLKLIHTIQQIEEPSCAAFQKTTKKHIAVGTKNGQVLLYDIKSNSVKKRFQRLPSAVVHVQFVAKDGHIVVSCGNGEVCIFNNTRNTMSGTFKIPKSSTINALQTNPMKRNLIAAGGNEGVVAVWDINNNKQKFLMESHKAPVTAMAFSTINSDLVVSTGLDRQFCFYDIEANKCIASVFVENSMTSVDFSPDGKYIIMGSQKGVVSVYDSRSIREPIHAFTAHTSTVKHLAFQKMEETEESIYEIGENIKQQNSEIKEQTQTDESLGMFVVSAMNSETKSATYNECGDSFMAAIGLNQNHTAESNCGGGGGGGGGSGGGEHVKSPHELTPNPIRIVKDKPNERETMPQISSTPKLLIQEEKMYSPIITSSQNANVVTPEIVTKEELKIMFGEFKKDIKTMLDKDMARLRQMYLDVQMSIVKESIKVDDVLNFLQNEFSGDVTHNQYAFFIENMLLKKKIAMLEDMIERKETRDNQSN